VVEFSRFPYKKVFILQAFSSPRSSSSAAFTLNGHLWFVQLLLCRRFEISAKLAKCQCYFWNLRNILEYETSMSPKHFTITVQIWRLWQEREFERHVRQGATEKSASSALIWVRHRTAVLSCAIHRSAHSPRCAVVRVLGNRLMPKIAISFKGSLTARHTNGNEDLERSKSWSNRVDLFTPSEVQPHQTFACGM